MKSGLEGLLNFLLEGEQPPSNGYHVTYLSRLPKILSQGLKPPGRSSRKRTHGEDRIYLFISPKRTKYIANDIDLARTKDWVLLKVSDLDKQHVVADDDFGDTWQESVKYGGTFAYNAVIPPENIDVVAKAQGTEKEYHDEFEWLQRA